MASNTVAAVPAGREVPLLIIPANNNQLMVHTSYYDTQTSHHSLIPNQLFFQQHVALKSWDGAWDEATTINHIKFSSLPSLVSNLRTLKHNSTTL